MCAHQQDLFKIWFLFLTDKVHWQNFKSICLCCCLEFSIPAWIFPGYTLNLKFNIKAMITRSETSNLFGIRLVYLFFPVRYHHMFMNVNDLFHYLTVQRPHSALTWIIFSLGVNGAWLSYCVSWCGSVSGAEGSKYLLLKGYDGGRGITLQDLLQWERTGTEQDDPTVDIQQRESVQL